MGWLRNAFARAPREPEVVPQSLDERLRAIEAKLTDMTASTGLLRVEWAEVLDKINRWASRQSGRLSRQAKAALDAAETAEDAPQAPIGGGPGSGRPATSKAELRRLAAMRRTGNGSHS